jgi:hypothetical protein
MTEVSIDICGLFGLILVAVLFIADRIADRKRKKK